MVVYADSIEDRYRAEVDYVVEKIDDCATSRDGSWLFDKSCRPNDGLEKHPADKPTPGLSRSPGTVRVFCSLATANAAAELAWHSLQVNHGFDGVAPVAEARSESSKGTRSAAKGRKQGSGKRSRASGSGLAGSANFCSVTGDGCCSWSCARQHYVDPWCKGSRAKPAWQPLHNTVRSTVMVEVVQAQVE